MRRLYKVALGAVAVEALGATYSLALLPKLRRWGATPEEVSRALPGDDLIAEPLYTTTHAITVHASPEHIWPWLVQIGQNRGGFYTYDALENLAGLRVRSAERIHPEWQDLRVGEHYLTLDPDETMKMTVVVCEPPHTFVVRSGAPGEPPQEAGSFFRGELAWTWGFYVESAGPAESRLVIRSRASWQRGAATTLAQALGLEPAHFIMEERMLRGIRDRAEQTASQAGDGEDGTDR